MDAIKPWLQDAALGAFAVRAIGRVADGGARRAAVSAFREGLAGGLQDPVRGDIERELTRLGESVGRPRSKRVTAKAAPPTAPSLSLEDLVIGRVYRRGRDLHDHGLGGNRQKGASYPKDGTYVLLFADPSRERDLGYRDSWQGPDNFRLYGEWNGTGDMSMTEGNAAIRDRSPELYLFVATQGGHRFEGRFACDGFERELAVRDGQQFTAIVFRLSRVRNPM